MLKKDNIIIKSLSPNEINLQNTEFIETQKPFLKKRLDAPLLKIGIGEKKNLIVIDEGCETMAMGFHYLNLTEKFGLRVMCGGYDGKCLLCALQKFYPEKIKPTIFYSCFTVVDTAEKKLKILLLHFKHLQNIYSLVLNTPEFLRGVAISITRIDKYTYNTSIEIKDKNNIVRYKSNNPNIKPFDYFQYFGPFTVEELEQLGFDISLIPDVVKNQNEKEHEGFLDLSALVEPDTETNTDTTSVGKIDNIIDNVLNKQEEEEENDIMGFIEENEFPESFEFKDDDEEKSF